LIEEMLAAEEAALLAAYRFEPWGDLRSDVGLAQIAQLLWNTNTKKGNHKKVTDFLPFYRKPVREDPNVESKIRSIFGKIAGKKE